MYETRKQLLTKTEKHTQRELCFLSDYYF